MHERRRSSLGQENCSGLRRYAQTGAGRCSRATGHAACAVRRGLCRCPAARRRHVGKLRPEVYPAPSGRDRRATNAVAFSGLQGASARRRPIRIVARRQTRVSPVCRRRTFSFPIAREARSTLFFRHRSAGRRITWGRGPPQTRDVASPFTAKARRFGAHHHDPAGHARVNSRRIKHLRLVRGPTDYKRQSGHGRCCRCASRHGPSCTG